MARQEQARPTSRAAWLAGTSPLALMLAGAAGLATYIADPEEALANCVGAAPAYNITGAAATVNLDTDCGPPAGGGGPGG